MALTAAQRKANDKYIKDNYKQVKLSMPNAEADTLTDYCNGNNKHGEKLSKAGFIREAVKEKMEIEETLSVDEMKEIDKICEEREITRAGFIVEAIKDKLK